MSNLLRQIYYDRFKIELRIIRESSVRYRENNCGRGKRGKGKKKKQTAETNKSHKS